MTLSRNIVLASLLPLLLAGPEAAGGEGVPGRREAHDSDYEVRIGWGWCPMFGVSDFGRVGQSGFFGYYFDFDPNYTETLAGIYLPGLGPGYMTGVISAEIDFNLKRWFSVTVGVGVNSAFQDLYDPVTGRKTGRNKGAAVTLLPEARFNWLNRGVMRMYSALGVGLGMDIKRNERLDYTDTGFFPVFQVTPFGISLGRKVYWFAEVGIGLQYIGGMTGVGMRF